MISRGRVEQPSPHDLHANVRADGPNCRIGEYALPIQTESDASLSSIEVRRTLVETLRLDLVGPNNDDALAQELLSESPTKWYLTGYLVPTDAPMGQRFDETSTEEIDAAGDTEGTDDATEPDRAAAKRSLLPSSMGVSVLVPAGVKHLEAVLEWGDYRYEGPGEEQEGDTATQAKAESGVP